MAPMSGLSGIAAWRSGAAAALIAVMAALIASPALAQGEPAKPADWREDYAYSLGIQAYVFGFPYIYLPTLRWRQVGEPGGFPSAPLNYWRHSRTLRDATHRLGGWIAVDAEETLYPTLLVDANGEALQDTRRYVLRFEKGQTPPANAFWSITMYGPDYNFVDNPINRYSIGDRTKGLKYDADGSLTLYLQKDAPGGDKNANWLPSGGGNFNLMMRTYMPKPEMLDGRWQPPPARRVD